MSGTGDPHAVSVARTTGRYAVLTAVLPVVATAVLGLVTKQYFDDQKQYFDKRVDNLQNELLETSLVAVNAEDVLRLDDSSFKRIGLTDKPVSVTGKLLKALPSGVQIWVGSEKVYKESEDATGPTPAFGVDEGGPCSVDTFNNTFICDNIYVGDAKENGQYRIFVGLANSTQSRQLVGYIRDQLCSSLTSHQQVAVKSSWDSIHKQIPDAVVCTRRFGHKPPDGTKWLPALVKVRSQRL